MDQNTERMVDLGLGPSVIEAQPQVYRVLRPSTRHRYRYLGLDLGIVGT